MGLLWTLETEERGVLRIDSTTSYYDKLYLLLLVINVQLHDFKGMSCLLEVGWRLDSKTSSHNSLEYPEN